MAKREELEAALPQFYGTEEWHPWSILFRNYFLTDGAKYLAEHACAYWLMDVIASWRTNPKVKAEYFQVWKMVTDLTTGIATVTCDDGNGHILAEQVIDWTDFPLPEIKLYAVQDGAGSTVIMLPTEY